MKKIAIVILSSVITIAVVAQSVADGTKAVYYEKYKTAKDIFQKIITANPADVDANYWLGQVFINEKDLASARNIYAKAMSTTNQNPLIVVGMGHVELMEGKAADARTHFDAALAISNNKKGGDSKILTAVGRANADGDSKTGDPVYGLDKLTTAAKLDLKDPDILILSGITQLKRGGEYGGEAKKAYEEALVRDPKYAKAKLRIAKIFQSQNNKELFIPLMEEATQLDPNYAPAWLALYDYYSKKDVNKAKDYLDHYISVADKDCETDFFYADYLLQAGKRDESLAKAKEIESTCGGDVFPKVYKLYATIYFRMGDSLNAKDYMAKYVAKVNPLKIEAIDYANYASILGKFSGMETEAEANMIKGIEKDTSTINKLDYIKQIADIFAKAKNYCSQLKWLNKVPSMKTSLTATDYYYWGDAATKCANSISDTALKTSGFLKADSIYIQYIAKYPEQPQGYTFRAIAAKLSDADTSKGTAIVAIDEYTTFLMKDTAKNKNRIIANYGYKIYHYVKRKDFQKVLDAANSILALDPVNAYGIQARDLANKIINKSNTPPKTPSKPAKNTHTPQGSQPAPGGG